jgi:hypothetical protein
MVPKSLNVEEESAEDKELAARESFSLSPFPKIPERGSGNGTAALWQVGLI